MLTDPPEPTIATSIEIIELLRRIAALDEGSGQRDRQLAQTALDALQQANPLPERAPRKSRPRGSGIPPKPGCGCGGCRWCVDNARWERIFNEKFHDPSYYGPLSVRHSSTLSDPR